MDPKFRHCTRDQMAAAAGGSVIAIDIVDKKLDMAKQLGAQHTINASDKEDKALLKEIRVLTGGGADIAIEAIANPKTIELASGSVKAGGLHCQVGYTHHSVPLNAGSLMKVKSVTNMRKTAQSRNAWIMWSS